MDPLNQSNNRGKAGVGIVAGVIDPNDTRYSNHGSAETLDSSDEGESNYESVDDRPPPARDQWGNIIVTKNIYINRLLSEDGVWFE